MLRSVFFFGISLDNLFFRDKFYKIFRNVHPFLILGNFFFRRKDHIPLIISQVCAEPYLRLYRLGNGISVQEHSGQQNTVLFILASYFQQTVYRRLTPGSCIIKASRPVQKGSLYQHILCAEKSIGILLGTGSLKCNGIFKNPLVFPMFSLFKENVFIQPLIDSRRSGKFLSRLLGYFRI